MSTKKQKQQRFRQFLDNRLKDLIILNKNCDYLQENPGLINKCLKNPYAKVKRHVVNFTIFDVSKCRIKYFYQYVPKELKKKKKEGKYCLMFHTKVVNKVKEKRKQNPCLHDIAMNSYKWTSNEYIISISYEYPVVPIDNILKEKLL